MTKKNNIPEIEDPIFRRLVELLPTMPQFLEERSRRIAERRAFVERVWGQAVKDAFKGNPLMNLDQE